MACLSGDSAAVGDRVRLVEPAELGPLRARCSQNYLRAHEVGGEPLAAAEHPDLPDMGSRADVQRLAERRQLVAAAGRGEHVELQLDGREATSLRQVAERPPCRD